MRGSEWGRVGAGRARSKRQREEEPKTMQCQRCYEFGHYTYECQNERPYQSRLSRSKELKVGSRVPVEAFPPGYEPALANDKVQLG
eukprot:gene13747-15962_t